MKAILIDIDHTLSDASWRDPMIGGEGGWDAYHNASVDDKVAEDVALFVRAIRYVPLLAVGCTARPEKFRAITTEWLLRHNIWLDHLLMRPDEEFRPSAEIKVALAESFFKGDLSQIVAVLDDHEGVISSFVARGVTAFHVRGRKYA
jgi:hypothetical protein